MSSFGIIREEQKKKCELCDKIAETRPYGKNGERVCFKCGMKDKKSAEKGIDKLIFGEK